MPRKIFPSENMKAMPEKFESMSAEQEQHLLDIKDYFLTVVDPKYRKGQAEHGGTLLNKSCLWLIDESIKEVVDQFVYLVTLKQQLLSIIDKNE